MDGYLNHRSISRFSQATDDTFLPKDLDDIFTVLVEDPIYKGEMR